MKNFKMISILKNYNENEKLQNDINIIIKLKFYKITSISQNYKNKATFQYNINFAKLQNKSNFSI